MKTTGTKYQYGRNIKDIAKDIRKDIKSATKAGTLPSGTKVSVKISRYSMGQSLTAAIKTLGDGVGILNPARVRWEFDNPYKCPNVVEAGEMYTPVAAEALKVIEKIVASYNYDNSDIMTDYYDVEFYGFTEIHWETRENERIALLDAYAKE